MKRYLHCVISNKKYSFINSKRRTVCGLVLAAVFLVFSLSAKSVFTDNYSVNPACTFNNELEGEKPFLPSKILFLATTPDQITVSSVASGDPTNCIDSNGTIIITAEGSNANLPLEYSIDGGTSFQLSNFFGLLSEGLYSVVVRYEDDTCPVSYGFVTLLDTNTPTIQSVSGTPVTDCGADNGSFLIDATGNGALEFSIDNGVNYFFNSFFSNLPAGDYSILVRSAGTDCVSSPEFRTITEPIAPTFGTATPTNLTGCSSNDGQIAMTASGGTNGNYEYTVDGGISWQSIATFAGLGAGEYAPGVRNADDDTCPDYGTVVTLTAPDAPQIGVPTVFNPSSCLASDGVITVNISNGDVNNLEFSLDNGLTWQAGNNFNGLAGGDYNIRVRTVDQSCFVDGPSVNLPGGLEPNIVDDFVQSVSNCGGNDGVITIIIDNDNGSFEYSIDNGTTFQLGNSFTGLIAGSYPVVVRAGDGSCSVNGTTFELTEPESPTIQTVVVNEAAACNDENSSIAITATGGQGSYSYSIDNGISFFFTDTFDNVGEGTYEVIVRNANGTCEINHTETINILEVDAPTFNGITASPTSSCISSDGSISINLPTGGTGAYEYSIDNGLTWQASNLFGSLAAGDYLLGIRNSDATCPLLENAAELLSSGSAIINNTAFTEPSDCGATDGIISVDVSGANTYEYSIDGINFQDSNTFGGLETGTYIVIVRINNGTCPVISDPITLSTNGGAITGVFPTNPTSCDTANGSILVEATGDDIVFSLNGIDFQASGLFENLSAGPYQISIRNEDGTCIVTGPIEILNSTDQPSVPTYFTENPIGCNTLDGTITVQVQNDPGNFQYSIDGGTTFQNSNTFSGLNGGEYNIIVTSAVCQTNGGAISLVEPSEPTIGALESQNPTSCDSDDGFIIVTGTGESDLEYSIDGGLNWQFFGTFNGLDAGTYNPAVRNQFMGTCPVIGDDITLSTADQASIAGVTPSNPSGCGVADGSITVSATGGTGTYEYSIDNGATFQSENIFEGLILGTYDVVVRNADGICSSSSEFVQLTPVGAPFVEIPLATQPSGCGTNNGIIVITASQGSGTFEYSIDGGNTYVSNNAFTGLDADTYSVFVRNADGTCPVNAGIVELNSTDSPNLNPTFTQGTSNCNGIADGLITILANNDDGTFEYSIDGGVTFQNNNQFSGVAVGTYNIFVRKGGSACVVSGSSVTISEPVSPMLISITPGEATCGVSNGSLVIEAQGGLPAYEFTIDGGSTWIVGNFFDSLPAGSYTPGVRNADSECSTIGNAVILTEDDIPTFGGAVGENPTGPGTNNGTITVTATPCGNNTLEYSINGGLNWQTSNFFDMLPPGIYQVEVRNIGDTDFIGNFEVVLTEPDVSDCPQLVGSLGIDPTTDTSNDGSVIISVSGDVSSIQYSIDGGVTFSSSPIFENLGIGQYQPFIQNVDGTCEEAGNTVELSTTGSDDLTLEFSNPSSCDVTDGSITVTSPIDFTYIFSIDGNDYVTNPEFTGLGAGTYTVSALNVVTDEEIFFATNPLVLTATGGPQATTTFTNPNCGTSDGTIDFSASGGLGLGYEYSIDGGATWSTEATFNNLPSGDYNPIVRNADGTCPTILAAISLVQTGTISITSIVTTGIGCGETTGTLTIIASGTDNILYSIDGGANFSPFATFNDLPVGTYSVMVQDATGGCMTLGGEFMVENTGGAEVDIEDVTINEPSGCAIPDGEITVDVNNVNNLEFSIDGGLNYQTNNIFTGLPEGSYEVFVRNEDGSCAVAWVLNPVQLTNDDQLLFVEDTITVNVADLLPGGKVCVPAPIGQLVVYNLVLNGEEYNEQLLGCDEVTIISYNGSFFDDGMGPYMIESWVCNGTGFNGQVQDLQDLRNQLNIWDPTGNWNILSPNSLVGGTDGVIYGDLIYTVVSTGGGNSINANESPLPNGTCIQVDGEGIYELVATNDSGCTDNITIIVEGEIINPPTPTEGEGDTIYLSTPMNIPTNPFCFTGVNLPTGEIATLGFCGEPINGGAPITDFENNCIAYFPNSGFLGQDEFCAVVCQEGDATGVICDTTVFIVTVHPPTNTVDVTVNTLETLEYCLEDPLLTLPGNIISGTVCGSIDTEITATVIDNCITFDPIDGFIGLTEVCIVHCDDSTPNSICDTTYFNVTVTPDCAPVFAEEEITVTSLQPTTTVCIPVPQLTLLSDYQIIVDGDVIPVVPAPCDVDTVYNYAYSSIPTGEPVIVNEWACNGQVFSFDLLDITDLIDSMQLNDPGSNWTVDLDNMIISGIAQGQGCGDMILTLAGGTAGSIALGQTFIANGGEVTLNGFGVHTIEITDLIGCSDTLTVNLNEDLEAQFISLVTPYETEISEICVDTTDLVGNWDGTLGYCITPTDGTAPILAGLPCVSYTPLNGFVGLDTMCLIVCDDIPFPNITCYNTTYVIQTLPPLDTIFIDAPSVSAFDTCLLTTDYLQLPGNIVSSTLCGSNPDELSVTIQSDTCLTIDLASALGLGTTEICIVHCDDTDPVFCDTTYIMVTGTIECEDFIAVSDTMLVTDMGVSTLCIPDILTSEIGAGIYTVELDGEPFTGPIGGCDFVDAFVYQTNTFPAGPFTMVSWTVNGVMFDGTANDITEIVALMNMWNPTGNWTFETIGNSIFGGLMDSIYGTLFVTNGIIISNDPAAPQQIPGGTQFVFTEPGEHVLVITNNETGCGDTVNINVLDGDATIIIETPQNEPDTTCFSISADYPNFDSLSICGEPLNGTFEILDDTCFVYTPNMDYLGEDEGCISVCSTIEGIVQCDTFDVIIDVIPNCEEDLIIADNIVLMLEDCGATVEYCLDVNGADLAGYTLTDNGTLLDATINCGGEILGGFYDYSGIPGLLTFGNFIVDSVDINGVTYSSNFSSVTALDDSLNVWDEAAAWSSNFPDSQLDNATTTGMYDTLFVTDVALGMQWQLPYVFETNGGDFGISLDLTAGVHQIEFTNSITTCTDVVNINVMCDDMMGCPELSAISDSEIIMPDCDFPVLFCVNLPVDSMVNYTITDNGNPYTAGFVACPDAMNSAALTLGEGEHNLVFTRLDGSCVEEIFVDVRCIEFIDKEIDITINLGQPEVICLYEDLDIDTTGIISIINTCDPNTNDNVNFIIDLETYCITLDPLMIGLDTACLEVCNGMGCITVTINVEVIEQCDDLFALDNVGAGITDCSAIEGELCLPILMGDLAGTDIFVGGVLYTGTRAACDVDSIYSLSLASVPAGGQLGPYGVFFDITDMDGVTTSFADTVDVIEDALALINSSDPLSSWIYQNFPSAFTGGSPFNTYGLTVVQNSSQETAIIGVDVFLSPNGTAITVPVGTTELVFEDQTTGCRDTLVSTVSCVDTDTLFLTLDVGMLDTLCFDTLDLPDNFATITNDCPELSGTNAEVIVIGNTAEQGDSLCVSFTGLEPGEDQACIVLCDDLGVCDTTYVFITVNSGDIDLPIAVIDSTITGQDQSVVFNPFANDTINGLLDTFYIVTQPNFGGAAFSSDGTINYVPEDDYCDPAMPDSLQYAICNTIGCDTAWVYITVDCGGIEIFNGFSPNVDGINDNFMIRGVEGFTESRLQIFNRWGNRVHDVINYQNNWNGTWNGKDLPDGTYFYILNLNDGSQDIENYSGYLEINR